MRTPHACNTQIQLLKHTCRYLKDSSDWASKHSEFAWMSAMLASSSIT